MMSLIETAQRNTITLCLVLLGFTSIPENEVKRKMVSGLLFCVLPGNSGATCRFVKEGLAYLPMTVRCWRE